MARRSANQLRELQALIVRDQRLTGTVVSINGNTARVATNRGTVTANIETATVLRAGDTVRVQGEAVIGRVRPITDVPVFDL